MFFSKNYEPVFKWKQKDGDFVYVLRNKSPENRKWCVVAKGIPLYFQNYTDMAVFCRQHGYIPNNTNLGV